jgi:hypothetical protein
VHSRASSLSLPSPIRACTASIQSTGTINFRSLLHTEMEMALWPSRRLALHRCHDGGGQVASNNTLTRLAYSTDPTFYPHCQNPSRLHVRPRSRCALAVLVALRMGRSLRSDVLICSHSAIPPYEVIIPRQRFLARSTNTDFPLSWEHNSRTSAASGPT